MRTLLRTLALSGALLMSAPALAQTAEELWQDGRMQYAAGQFEDSLRSIVGAIQADPRQPDYYLGLARAYYRAALAREDAGDKALAAARLDAAVFYYDLYLDEFVRDAAWKIPKEVSARAKSERDSANSIRATPKDPARAPDGQDAARDALLERARTGPVLTASLGGAWALYNAMLRAGYARPDLLVLRGQLRTALLREAGEQIDPSKPGIPPLTIDELATQKRRFELARELAPLAAPGRPGARSDGTLAETEDKDLVAAQLAYCDGQIAALNLNWDIAASRFRDAIARDPRHIPARMGLLNALLSDNNARRADIELALDGMGQAVGGDAEGQAYLEVYRAIADSRFNRPDSAVGRITRILFPSR